MNGKIEVSVADLVQPLDLGVIAFLKYISKTFIQQPEDEIADQD